MKTTRSSRTHSSAKTAVCVVVLALAALSIPQQVTGYHFFYLSGQPTIWRTATITPVIDNDSASFKTTAQTAMDRWNAVATAKDIFGTATVSAVNFVGGNYLTDWGKPDDGKFEIVCDTDGTIATKLGLSAGNLGYGPTISKMVDGKATIVDGFFTLNCKQPESADFSYLGTMIHELGHDLGLAHTPVYQGTAAAETLEPVASGSAPTMYPYSIPGNDAASATLEEDDKAGFSELYPEATFASTYGTISGTVTRCTTDEAVKGAIVRAVSTSNSAIQYTRYSSYDGNATGAYDMKVTPGTYHLIIETLALNTNAMAVLKPRGNLDAIHKDFSTEYKSPATDENNCTEDLPDTAENVVVAAGDEGQNDVQFAGATTGQNFKTNPVELAFVVDDTGSMGSEIAAVRQALTNEINRLKTATLPSGAPVPYPNTAIITFKDNVTNRKISRDPVVLQAAVNALTASGGGDCPEHSNDALLVAGRLLRNGGKAMLFTDADSHPSGATSGAVSSAYAAKSLRLSVLLSGTCSGEGYDRPEGYDPNGSQNPDAAPEDKLPAEPTLGVQTSIETNSSIVSATGGMFAMIPGIKTGDSTERTRYINTGTNIAVSAASLPTIGLTTPGDGPQGSTIDVDINGSNTNFQSSSAVSFSGTGITVNSRTVRSATLITVNITIAASATTGFRDVTVTTSLGSSTETATGVGAFNVRTPPTTATIASINPSSGAVGKTFSVTIKGINTSFTSSSVPLFCLTSYYSSCSSTADRDTNITVNSVSATDATTLVANITVASGANVSYRNVSVITGTQVATESVTGPFLVTAAALSIPTLTAISPSSGSTGQTLNVSITGDATAFVNGTSLVSFSGSGITVNSTSVTSATAATANITIASSATPGFRDVFVTTGGETAALLNGFNILGGPPTAEPATGLYASEIVGNQVTLRFTPPAGGLSPTGYVVEGGISPGQVLGSLPTGSTSPIFTFSAPTGAFYVRVHTLSGSSRSTASNEIRIFVNVAQAPSAPDSLTGAASGSNLTLSWRNTFGGGTPLANVLDVTGAVTTSLPLPSSGIFSYSGVPPGTYTFRVRSNGPGGASTQSNAVTLTFPASTCTGVPQAPTRFLAYKVGQVITIVWEPPTGGPAPAGYTLAVSGTFNLTLPTTGLTLQGAVPAGTYTFAVRGTNACGAGAATASQTVVIP